MKKKIKKEKRKRRHKRVRAKTFGTVTQPRLCVFRSNKHIYAQLINDESRKTLIAASDLELKKERKSVSHRQACRREESSKEKKITRTKNITIAYEVGKLIAKKALIKKIEKVVFDRGGYKYHGRVKALAEGAREGGLKF